MFPHGIRQCDRCENPATVHLTEIRGGKKTERHLCESCAKTQFHAPTSGPEIQKLLKAFDPHKIAARTVGERGPTCPECGLTLAEFKQLGRFGCAHDYEAFGHELTGLFKKIHGATRYTGKAPDGRQLRGGETQEAVRRMRRDLDSAIDEENYEEAARLRDEIRRIQDEGLDDEDGSCRKAPAATESAAGGSIAEAEAEGGGSEPAADDESERPEA